MPRYEVWITETATYTTVLDAPSQAKAEVLAENKFLASIEVAAMFCTTVDERDVSAKLLRKRKSKAVT